MPRIARVVVPGLPHHVTQRGNRRADVFFERQDRLRYLSLLGKYIGTHRLGIWAYCLMSERSEDPLGRQPRPLRSGAGVSRLPRVGLAGRPSGLCVVAQPQDVSERTLMAGPVLFVRPGRRAPLGGGPLRGAEPGSRGPGGTSRAVAMVECRGPLRASERPSSEPGGDALAGSGLVGVSS